MDERHAVIRTNARRFLKTVMPHRACLAALILAGLFFSAPTPAGAATAVVTQADVSAYGRIPGDTRDVYLTHNGAANPVSHTQYTSAFVTNIMVLPGPPATITNVLTVSIPEPGDWDDTDTATIAITVNTTTGAVTATGSDPDGTILGTAVTLTADGTAAAGPVSNTFLATTTGDISDRGINVCATFSSGVQFCLRINLQDNTPVVPPQDQGAFDAAIQALTNSNYADAFRMMTEQMSVTMIQQLHILGTFFDAKHQLETQRLFATTAAIAHRDYHPSEQVCGFGTLARGTAVSKYQIEQNAQAMNSILQKRELLNANVSSAWGPYADSMSRMAQFKTTYCDVNDNNMDFPAGFCNSGASTRKHKDIDYRGTLERHLTLDLDFTDGGAPTADEEDILALAKNLFSHETLPSIQKSSLVPYGTFRELHNTRMLSAVRGVARHSFTTLAAMRASGTGLSATQLHQVMQNIGVPAGDINELIGANPSYFAQMDILTQKMFQDPAFMINLYNGPANVARMGVVLQGIRIMADRDKLDAALRREMLISMILEMKLRERQEKITNLSNKTPSIGK